MHRLVRLLLHEFKMEIYWIILYASALVLAILFYFIYPPPWAKNHRIQITCISADEQQVVACYLKQFVMY